MAALEPLPGQIPPASAEIELRPAKINDRFIAYFLDIAPFAVGYCLTMIVMVLKLHAAPDTADFAKRMAAIWFGVYLLYQFMGNATGATIGKRMMGIRIVRKDGQPLGIIGSFMRALGYALSTPLCNLGFLLALIHPESRALHDLLAGSLVIEPRPKNSAEAVILFFGAFGVVSSLYGAMIYLTIITPTPNDLLAVEKAKDGLKIMAQIEENYKTANGRYTASLGDLASTSGDADKFRGAMGELFDPDRFQLKAGNNAYRISAAAKDRKGTRVTIEGPPAALVP